MALAIGRELEDLVGIDVGGFSGVAGLVLAGPTAWIVGADILIPTLIGELPFGVKDREMRQDEWDWAARVFGPSLPPRDQIHITNLRGLGNREFVSVKEPGLLNPSRRYLVHMGEQAFENPTTDTNPGWEVPGQAFMHELRHVWDGHWSGPGWMATAIFADRNPSPPSPNSDWRRLSVEEKATIVHNWYGRYHENLLDQAAPENPYFHYIRDNIRVPNN